MSEKTGTKTTYKVCKAENSDVITLPQQVREHLGIKSGGTISFSIKNDKVVLEKNEEIPIDEVIKNTINQYHELIGELANH
ncbi:AbrB/MazE/SpoVT family DNA-binding domain-containing protein [Enterococcus sp. AZ194]|uniref:AbrB/MazE/SpoVT family DNA-binding domain-containing protein n=1 Tax=Enterococcus sp. AZ194 TaxID=2774629 RepID=UPI003F6859E9